MLMFTVAYFIFQDDMALFRMKFVYEHIDKTEVEERSYPFLAVH